MTVVVILIRLSKKITLCKKLINNNCLPLKFFQISYFNFQNTKEVKKLERLTLTSCKDLVKQENVTRKWRNIGLLMSQKTVLISLRDLGR